MGLITRVYKWFFLEYINALPIVLLAARIIARDFQILYPMYINIILSDTKNNRVRSGTNHFEYCIIIEFSFDRIIFIFFRISFGNKVNA